MHLHIVERYHSKAMRRHVEPLLKHAPPNWVVTESEEIDPNADINFHVPWHSTSDITPSKSKHVSLFTHCNPGLEGLCAKSSTMVDGIVCMSYDGRDRLEAMGVVGVPIRVIYPDDGGYRPRQIVVGVVGAEQPDGRKHSHLLIDLAWYADLSPYYFKIVGTGWKDVVSKMRARGAHVDWEEEVEDIGQFYNSLDVLVSTGYIEGGPLPVFEALSAGLVVLSPPYGLAKDLLSADHFYNNIGELAARLQAMSQQVLNQTTVIAAFTEERMASETFSFLQYIVDGGVISRYDWLPKLIIENNCKRIVEVGVFQGERALTMIQAAGRGALYVGFDLFRGLTPQEMSNELSKQPWSSEQVHKLLSNTGAAISLWDGYSRDSIPHANFDSTMDLIFIDGGHSFATIEEDWKNVQKFIGEKTIIVFDDYYYDRPEGVGCQEVVDGLSREEWEVVLLQPVEQWATSHGIMKIGMVEVKKRGG